MDPITVVQDKLKPLAKIGAIFGVLAAVGVGINFYLNNIWQPPVKVLSVDYTAGIAQIEVTDFFFRKHEKTLYNGSSISAGASWCVRFGGREEIGINRVELAKNDIVYKTLSLANVN